ncbi:PASTA domain-containing protein [Pseudarthrobacter sp. NPDC092439]|uniref:PASTA domain-containing protein n=1 Tax=unclassified Pseudarthrobacter TaxID=2647000 RepID=UPI0037FBB363
MKSYSAAILAVLFILGISACGSPSANSHDPKTAEVATPSPSQTSRTVPDLKGKSVSNARSLLNNAGLSANIFGTDGKEWVSSVPDNSVKVVSTVPAGGSATTNKEIRVNVDSTETENTARAAAAAEAAALAARYTFICTDDFISGDSVEYKSLKEVWASPAYKDKNSGPCRLEIDGLSAYEVENLLPKEAAIAKVIASHGGGSYGSPAGDFGTAMEMCAKPASDLADQVSGVPGALQADAYGALALCPKAPHAALLRQVATTIKVGDGTRTVGKDMPPGTYQTRPGAKDCYWSRTDGGGNIIDNNFVGFAPDGVTVTVFPGEGFESNNCPVWTKIG